jgi:metallo-beta-lactamase class B
MLVRLLLLLAAFATPGLAQINPEWTANHKPFRIVGNLYYVGSGDLAAYLVTTPQGSILINANLATSVPQIRHNIEALGLRFADIKILLNSQAHYDHAAGTAEIRRLTHAKVEVMQGDVPLMESGARKDFYFYNQPEFFFTPVKVDHILNDGEQVTLGGSILTAHLTAGHTPGTTTWTIPVTEAGRTYNVLIFGGATALEPSNLIDNPRYPTQAVDLIRTFQTLRSLPCDIFLGAHGDYFGMKKKYLLLQPGQPNPFIDPAGYLAYVDEREQFFRKELAKQTAARKK